MLRKHNTVIRPTSTTPQFFSQEEIRVRQEEIHQSVPAGRGPAPSHPYNQPQGPTLCPICHQAVPTLELVHHILQHTASGMATHQQLPSQTLPAPPLSAFPGHFMPAPPAAVHSYAAPGGPAQASSFGWHPAAAYPADPDCRYKAQKLKSGKVRSSNPDTRFLYLWPHEVIDDQLAGKTFTKYTDLSEVALAAGLFETIIRSADYQFVPSSIKLQLTHYSSLFHALTSTNNLPAVLGFHEAVLERLERGQLTWSDTCRPLLESMRLNFLASLRKSAFSHHRASSQVSSQASSSSSRTPAERSAIKARYDQVDAGAVCPDYSRGRCDDTDCQSKHVCKHCFAVRNKEAEHTPEACPEAPSAGSGRRGRK